MFVSFENFHSAEEVGINRRKKFTRLENNCELCGGEERGNIAYHIEFDKLLK